MCKTYRLTELPLLWYIGIIRYEGENPLENVTAKACTQGTYIPTFVSTSTHSIMYPFSALRIKVGTSFKNVYFYVSYIRMEEIWSQRSMAKETSSF